MTWVIIVVVVYLAFHFGAGTTHHRYAKAHGLNPNFYWSSVRGPYGSVRLPGGFRVGHRLLSPCSPDRPGSAITEGK